MQVSHIQTSLKDITSLLQAEPSPTLQQGTFATEQCRDPNLQDMIVYLQEAKLPQEEERARKIALQCPPLRIGVTLNASVFTTEKPTGEGRE